MGDFGPIENFMNQELKSDLVIIAARNDPDLYFLFRKKSSKRLSNNETSHYYVCMFCSEDGNAGSARTTVRNGRFISDPFIGHLPVCVPKSKSAIEGLKLTREAKQRCSIEGVAPLRSKKLGEIDQISLGLTASMGRIQSSPSVELMSTQGVSPFNALTLAVEPFTKSELALKMARRKKLSILSAETREKVKMEKYKISRNLFVVSVAFLFVVSAFQGLQNLQLSVNRTNDLGAYSLTTIYIGSVASCMFLPPYLLNRIGCKLTLVTCMSIYSLYMLINFVPEFYSMIPGSLFLGLAMAPLWAAKCTYLTETGFRYAALNLEQPNVVIVRFFGIFFMIVHLGQVFGNLISSNILRLDPRLDNLPPPQDSLEPSCGHLFISTSNLTHLAEQRMQRPGTPIMLSLYGSYFCCTLVAIMVVFMFVDELHMDRLLVREKPRFKLDMWNKTLHHMKQPRHLFIIPLTIFNGLEQSFIAGEFTKAYVACCLGVHNVGFVMTSFGAADAVCSLFFGPLIKLFGRMPLLMFAAVVDMLMIFTLLIWPPNPADTAIFYVIAAAWGMADAVWNTQINGVWAVLFTRNLEVAFANYRLWESFGFIIGFLTTNLQIHTKLYLLLGCLLFGMFGYGLIELWEPLEVHAMKIRKKVTRLRSDRSKYLFSQDNLAMIQSLSAQSIAVLHHQP